MTPPVPPAQHENCADTIYTIRMKDTDADLRREKRKEWRDLQAWVTWRRALQGSE